MAEAVKSAILIVSEREKEERVIKAESQDLLDAVAAA